MKKEKSTFNAIATFTDLARLLDNSRNEILGFYHETFAKYTVPEEERKISSEEEKKQLEEKIQSLGKFLKTTPVETLLFVAVYASQISENGSVDIRDIVRYFAISNLDFLPLKSSLVSLLQKGLIRSVERRGRLKEYLVSSAAENALLTNKVYKPVKNETDRYKFCEKVSDLIDKRSDNDIETRELFEMVQEEEQQDDLLFVKEMQKLLPDVEDRVFFYEMCDDYLRDRGRHGCTGVDCTLADIYDRKRARFNQAKLIMEKKHPLLVTGLAELLPAAFFTEAEMGLTEKGARLFLEADYELFQSKGASDRRLTPADKIPDRKLFFNEELTKDLDFVRESLMDDSFVKLQERLASSSLPKGVTMLFHGLPGTGKTAAAEMIAKQTGRAVYHVDIAASKSMWFGESEKLFKRIFTDYRRMCETEELKPILLFNEADALFSRRKDVTSGSCAQTENALQNILLEEMENLDGILIATTNLSTNFDNAFERRFLFKINFGQPDTQAKKSIWQSKLDWLSVEEATKLAEKYNLSGGEIDNIVRKTLMEDVLHGQRPTFETISSWCKGEKLDSKKGGAIGFAKN